MTLPTLVQKYRNRVVETRLQKFYSAINQAVKMAELEYGDKKYGMKMSAVWLLIAMETLLKAVRKLISGLQNIWHRI